MLSSTCHCGAVRVEVPSAPEELTNCNCSLCRRLGGLWAYYPADTVKVHGHPENTDEYIQGDRTLRTVRCKTCGCTTHWEALDPAKVTKIGVNMRNFDPEGLGPVRIRLLDGADTWKSFYWEDIA
ncbi:GFA family protein [Ideonella sp. BN130291]|uniref:GFA family protein n=1 Tax=Ideonella sp. BN130291 TaxID=3112940 RepID=UPI002E25F865|nr:GFA family protein [Ideonella sp. BN130291]